MSDPYAEFSEAAVLRAEREIARDKLSAALGRELTDEDILIWLRARRALVDAPEREYCEVLSEGPAQWCGERGAFVQFRVTTGPQAGMMFESTAKEFAKRWREPSATRVSVSAPLQERGEPAEQRQADASAERD